MRTFQDLGIDQLKVHSYDGATIEPAYEPPIGPWPLNTEDTKRVYQGDCHCGDIILLLGSKPLEDLEVNDCNCNI